MYKKSRHGLLPLLAILSILGLGSAEGSIALDFSTYDSPSQPNDPVGPGNPTGGMRFVGIGVEGGTTIDLAITAVTTHTPKLGILSGVNGTGQLGRINLKNGTSTVFDFEFYETGTTNPVTIADLSFTFFDFDGTAAGNEFLTMPPRATYTLTTATEIDTSHNLDGSVTFTATEIGGGGDNPDAPPPPAHTTLQENRTVMFNFTNVDGFRAELGVNGTANNGGRNILFADETVFSGATQMGVIPEPSPLLIMVPLLLSALVLVRRREPRGNQCLLGD